MTNYIFDQTQCSLPAILSPVFPLITDCAVWVAPAPIYETPPVTVPIDVPFDVPCPSFVAAATVNLSQIPGTPVEPTVNVTVTNVPSSLGCLDQFDFDIQLPIQAISCPGMTVATHVTAIRSLNVPGVTVTGVRNTGSHSQCAFAFDFDFDLPAPPSAICPNLTTAATAEFAFGTSPARDTHDNANQWVGWPAARRGLTLISSCQSRRVRRSRLPPASHRLEPEVCRPYMSSRQGQAVLVCASNSSTSVSNFRKHHVLALKLLPRRHSRH